MSDVRGNQQPLCLAPKKSQTGGSQHVTVKHIHQQVNVTEGGQAVVAGEVQKMLAVVQKIASQTSSALNITSTIGD
jgi:hypothetical protein